MHPVTVREKWGLEHSLPLQLVRPGKRRYRVQVAYWDERGVRVAALNQAPLWLPYEALDLRSLSSLLDLKRRAQATRAKVKVKTDGA